MDLNEELKQFTIKINTLKDSIATEEATKTSLVLPFFQLLGYDIFNPLEFVPEYTTDVGTKKGEKVDYAILKDNEPMIIIEVKSCGTQLNNKHINQLLRYFSVTKAKFGILTNGVIYRFYSDLEEVNKMDNIPFLEINLLDINESLIPELKRFQKEAFNLKDILCSASELKYTAMIKNVLAEQLSEPTDQFIKAILNKGVYSGVKTQAVMDKFRVLVKTSFNEYINELLRDKLNTVIEMGNLEKPSLIANNKEVVKPKSIENEITKDEKEMLDFIAGLIEVDEEILYKKTDKYLAIQLGNNVRRWVCRIFLKKNQKVFLLHKFDDYDYEEEYYFEEICQLEVIKDLISGVANLCISSK
ncbi:type I restriction endonuclease [Clostridium sp. B9]|uniref:type I restriction endonuclease n=1 Tax=Clostridium sp. B9 TaxID=3423224 RepID=UPI003D2EE7D0